MPKKESKFHQKKKRISLNFPILIFLSVYLKQEEKLTLRCSRDGGVETLEVHGMIMLCVKSEEYGRIIIAIDNKESRNIQLQVNKRVFI